MMPKMLIEFIEKELTIKTNKDIRILDVKNISGGCINNAASIKTNSGMYFLKWNTLAGKMAMFEAEAKGLQLLRDSKSLIIPEVLFVGQYKTDEFICMEFIEKGAPHKDFWFEFGRALGRLHKIDAPEFGLPYNNFIGSLDQSNKISDSWVEFFVLERLEPMIRMAGLSRENNNKFEKLFIRIENYFPKEPPCLLHGDLWSGNYMINSAGNPVIFDPAVYFGHREMDIAMTRLFGGFDGDFYQGYNTEWELEKGWEERVDICNLYPLMVHVNLFGNSYLRQVASILDRFISL